MSFDGQKLLALLPALYRLRDAQAAQSTNLLSPTEQAQLATLQSLATPPTPAQQATIDALTAKAARGPLASLLMVLAEQIAVVEQDLDQLYDDQFIETCAPWVIPYIGDLVGYQPVRGIPAGVASPRAEVASTIALRRRKGTALALEQLARDVTGWGAHAVEFFQLLAVTQYMNHIRCFNHYAPDLRHWQPRAYIDSAFDRTAHSVDVRRIAVERGRYNLQNVGIFLWSLNAYSVTMAPAATVAGSPLCFRFSSLGRDTRLFVSPRYQGLDIATPAGPLNVPAPLRRLELCSDIHAVTRPKPAPPTYYGAGLSLVLQVDGKPLAATAIAVCDLSGADGSWINMPAAGSTYAAAIDPELGRIALASPASGPAPSHDVRATYYYGFNADMGGGEYSRESTFAVAATDAPPVAHVPGDFPGSADAVAAAVKALAGNGVVEIADSGTYRTAGFNIDVLPSGHVELRAADGCRPTLVLGGEITVSGGANAAFDLNGLLITASASPSATMATLIRAQAQRPNGQASTLSHLGVTHCTLVPGWALNPTGAAKFPGQPVFITEPSGLAVVIAKSIVGAIRAPAFATVVVADSIVDANGKTQVAYAAINAAAADQTGPGGALTLQNCTIIGKAHASLLSLASNCIFWSALATSDTWPAPLWADRKQSGCVRFSCLPPGAITPRQFECVTDGPPGPLFGSLLYGDPAYGKLIADTDDTIRRGADDGGEMGAFHFVAAPLREIDLRARLLEYLPVGMEFGIFYES